MEIIEFPHPPGTIIILKKCQDYNQYPYSGIYQEGCMFFGFGLETIIFAVL